MQVKPLIIHFGDDDDSSDDEDARPKNSKERPLGSLLDALLKQARQQTEQLRLITVKKTRHSKVYQRQPVSSQPQSLSIQHLTQKEQQEYLKLREKLDRQIKIKQLQTAEADYLKLKNGLPAKTSKLTALKCKLNRRQLQFADAQKRYRDAYEAYQAAQLLLEKSTSDLNAAKFELKKSSAELDADKTACVKRELECKRIGEELKGADYTIPNLSAVQTSAAENREKRAENVSRKRKASECTPRKHSMSENDKQKQLLISDERIKMQEKERELTSRLKMFEGITNPNTQPAEKRRKLEEFKAEEAKKKSQIDEKAVASFKENVEKHVKLFAEENCVHKPLSWTFNLMTCPLPSKGLKQPFALSVGSDSSRISNHVAAVKSSATDSYESVLTHLHSYRLRQNGDDLVDSSYANNVQPSDVICRYDLLGSCSDKMCKLQHKSKYLLDNHEKIVDVLLYDPSVAKVIDGNDAKDETRLRNRLLEFTRRFLKEPQANATQLLKLIKNSGRVKSNDLAALTRAMKHITQSIYTFHDYSYDIKVRDKSLVLTHAKVAQLKANSDPEETLQFRGRFFEPQRASFDEELTKSLDNNPKNAQLWLKLAYHKLTQESKSKNSCLVDALQVLRNALEHNEKDAELWENYLFLHSNAKFDPDCPTTLELCKKAVAVCPQYRLWKAYINHAASVEDKIEASRDLINSLTKRAILSNSSADLSHMILEAVTYRARLFVQMNRHDRAETLMKNALIGDIRKLPYASALDVIKEVCRKEETNERLQLAQLPVISRRLTPSDRIILWLCYFMLKCNRTLPCIDCEPLRQGYSGISTKNVQIISWSKVTSETLRIEILSDFAVAFDSCYVIQTIQEKFDTCVPLFVNLWQFEMEWKRDRNAIVPLFMELVDHRDALALDESTKLWLLIADSQMNSEINHEMALNTITSTKQYQAQNLTFLYVAAYLNLQLKREERLKHELFKLVRPYIDDQLDLTAWINRDVKLLFKAVICDCDSLDLESAKIRARYVKYPVRSAKLWLGYM